MAQEQKETLLRAQPAKAPPAPANREKAAGEGFPWLVLCLTYLTFNSVLTIRRANGDWDAISFVIFADIDLVLLFFCLRWFERAAPDSATRGRLRVAVCFLVTLMHMVVSYKIAAIMPVAGKVLIWVMACASALFGFYISFVHAEPKVDSPSVCASEVSRAARGSVSP